MRRNSPSTRLFGGIRYLQTLMNTDTNTPGTGARVHIEQDGFEVEIFRMTDAGATERTASVAGTRPRCNDARGHLIDDVRQRSSVGSLTLLRINVLRLLVLLLVTACGTQGFAQPQTKDDIIPGAVRLKNGLILRGLCSSGHSLTSGPLTDSRLDLRKIDQGFRAYYVATRQSEPIVMDPLVIPRDKFVIIQRSVSQKPMNYSIGLHERKPFAPDGKSRVSLYMGGGEKIDIDVGIMGIDRRYAKVRGLTHRWIFGVSIKAIPDATFYSGIGRPGLLPNAEGFRDGETRLNMVQMLMEAGKFSAALRLLEDTATEFPALKPRCEGLTEKWNELFATVALTELARMKESGRYETARNYARRWPDARLDAVIRVRARQFLDEIEEEQNRVTTIARSLDLTVGQLEDAELRRQAMQLTVEVRKELNVHTLSRFEAYEILWKDEGLRPEQKIALAVTGMILGGGSAIDDFAEARGLMQSRYLIRDYLATEDTESSERERLIEQLRTQEGYTVERAGLILQHLPPDASILSATEVASDSRTFTVAPAADAAGCVGILPGEYNPSRRYPLIVAFPRGGGPPAVTAAWWAQQAERNGCIVVVPELYPPTEGQYDASADQHREFLNLLTKLKTGLAIDDERIFIGGHGIGAEAAMDLATSHPDLFSGVVPLAGLGRRHFQWAIGNCPDLPWYLVSGTRQPFYGSRMIPVLRKIFTRVPSRGRLLYCNAVLALYPERGFESYAEELPDIFEWMEKQRRPDWSDRINATVLRSTDQSWFWLELGRISERYISLDDPGTPEDRPENHGQVDAEINGNSIRIRSLPGPAELRLSPTVPELDLELPIRISRTGRSQRVEYRASIRDLLDDFRERRDRTRLCFMKVPIE